MGETVTDGGQRQREFSSESKLVFSPEGREGVRKGKSSPRWEIGRLTQKGERDVQIYRGKEEQGNVGES